GRNRSSANFVAPVTLAVASTLRSALPTTRSSASPIQRLRHRLGAFAAHASRRQFDRLVDLDVAGAAAQVAGQRLRSEEHTSELQSLAYLVCRLLLAKKNTATK